MSTNKLKSIFTANNGGFGCRPKPTDIIEPQPKFKSSFSDQNSSHPRSSSPSSSARRHGGGKSTTEDEDYTSTPHRRRDHTIFSKTVAVVKDSDDPYHDFQQSMLQMIFEKEIYSRNNLQQLLDCFLRLNSPHHHEVIVQAFVEIWNGGGGKATEDAPSCSSTSFTFT